MTITYHFTDLTIQTLNGTSSYDWFGYQIANGCGRCILVGAPSTNTHLSTVNPGKVYEFCWNAGTELFELRRTIGGPHVGSLFGAGYLNCIGDINNDGQNDIGIGGYTLRGGAPGVRPIGQFFLIFDSEVSNVTSLNGVSGTTFNAPDSCQLGSDSAPLGDFNGDGIDDFVVASCQSGNGCGSGVAYVVYGRKTFPATFDLSTLSGPDGFAVRGGWLFALSLAGGKDINGDGHPDLLIGSFEQPGRVYVLYGGRNYPASFSTSSISTYGGTAIYAYGVDGGNGLQFGPEFGRSVALCNVDGKPTIITTAPFAAPDGLYKAGVIVMLNAISNFSSVVSNYEGLNGYSIIKGDLENLILGYGTAFRCGADVSDSSEWVLIGSGEIDSNYHINTARVYGITSEAGLGTNVTVTNMPNNSGFIIEGPTGVGFGGGGMIKVGSLLITCAFLQSTSSFTEAGQCYVMKISCPAIPRDVVLTGDHKYYDTSCDEVFYINKGTTGSITLDLCGGGQDVIKLYEDNPDLNINIKCFNENGQDKLEIIGLPCIDDLNISSFK